MHTNTIYPPGHPKRPEVGAHRLVVKSLRDIEAECACGLWHMMSPTFDRDTDEELRARVSSRYSDHLRHQEVRNV